VKLVCRICETGRF